MHPDGVLCQKPLHHQMPSTIWQMRHMTMQYALPSILKLYLKLWSSSFNFLHVATRSTTSLSRLIFLKDCRKFLTSTYVNGNFCIIFSLDQCFFLFEIENLLDSALIVKQIGVTTGIWFGYGIVPWVWSIF